MNDTFNPERSILKTYAYDQFKLKVETSICSRSKVRQIIHSKYPYKLKLL